MRSEAKNKKINDKKIIDSNLSNNNLGFSIKIFDFSEEKEEFTLNDEKSIYLLIKL